LPVTTSIKKVTTTAAPGAELAGDGLGAEARDRARFCFFTETYIDHDGSVDADPLDRYDDAVAIAVEKHSASILFVHRSEENAAMRRDYHAVQDAVIAL
jgi:hypothetical protein